MSSSSPLPRHGAPSWEAIGRFLAGESPAEEADAVAAWLLAHPEDAALVDGLDAAASRLGRQIAQPVDTEAALNRVLARRAADREAADTSGQPAPRPVTASRDRDAQVTALDAAPSRRRAAGRRGGWWPAPLAAAAGLALVAGAAWWLDRGPDGARGGPATVAATQRRVTAPGARDSLTLPDGTAVVLGPASVLSYGAGYGDATREVTLEGDGYFVVERDDARPFTVLAGDARIVDLGTAFAVRAEPGGDVAVTVTSGRVRLAGRAPASALVELAAGDAARLAAGADAPERVAADTTDALAWTRGLLVLRDTPVRDLPARLARWYGVALTIDPSLAERRVSATFADEDVADVIAALAQSLGARGELRGDSAVLLPAGAR